MVYQKRYPGGWKNKPDASTPFDAATGNHMEQGILEASQKAELAVQNTPEGRQALASSTEVSSVIAGVAFAPRPTTAVTTGIFDAARSVYNLKPKHLRRTRAKLAAARAGVGLCMIAGVGHSMVAGTTAVPGLGDWPAQLVDILDKAGFPRAGEGLMPGYSNVPTETRLSFPSGPGSGWGAFNTAKTTLIRNSTNENPAVWTSRRTGTIADVYYWQGSGPFTVSIDGGSAVTVTPDQTQTIGKTSFTGLPDTAHAVTIKRLPGYSGAQANVFMFGVDVRKATGVALANVGIGGVTVSGAAAVELYAPMNLAARGALADLIFIEVMHNDLNAGTTPAAWKAGVQTAINQAIVNGADVVLLTDSPVATRDQVAYTAALYELADSNDLPLIDLRDHMGAYAVAAANGLVSADTVHPSPTGYAEQARAIYNALGL